MKTWLKIGGAALGIIGLLLIAALLLPFGSPTLIPRKELFGNPERAQPSLSPDGKQLAYLAPDAQDVLNIWVMPVNEKDTAIQATSDHKRGIRQFLWQYDNLHLLYLQDVDGDENWHVFQTNPETKVTRDLTPFFGIRADLIAYDPSHPKTLLIQLNLRDRSRFDIYRLDLESGAIVLDTPNPGQAYHLVADHNLIIRAAQSYTKDGGVVIHTRDDADAPWRELLHWGPEETFGEVVAFSPDNQSLYVITSLDANTARLLQIDLKGGERTLLAADPNYDIDKVLIEPQTHKLQAIGVERQRFGWQALDPGIQQDLKYLENLLGPSFQISSRTLDDRHWILAVQSDVKPTHYYAYDRNKQRAEFLFSSRTPLDRYKMSTMQPITFQASDGMQLQGYLTLPIGKRAYHLPTVLLVHGGPWSRDVWGFSPMVQWLANRGYAVLQVNFRGSTGLGKAYLNAGDREWGGKMQQDLIDAKQWAVDQGIADPAKVAIFGGSYGGYATLAALTFTPQEFCCGVDVVGPSNLITLLNTFPAYWSPLRLQFERRVGSLEQDIALLTARSPLHRADNIQRPLLIGQGANDPRVKQAESDQIVKAMRQNKQSVDYLLFPDEGHGFVRPVNRLKFYAAVERFLKEHLGGREEKPSLEENWQDVQK